MSVDIGILTSSVLTLFLFMLPGFIVRRTGIADAHFSKSLSVLTLYVAQVSLFLYSFIREYDREVFLRLLAVFLFSILSHTLFYGLSFLFFRRAPDAQRRVLRFGVIFSNAGYMGVPLISAVFGSEYAIYATVYIVAFNIFSFSIGRLIFTNDRKYISVKKMILNPAVVPILIGLVFFFTPLNRIVPQLVMDALRVLQSMVAPVSMIVIGANLADMDFKGALKDRYTIPFVFLRLFLFPAIFFVILKLFDIAGALSDPTLLPILLILSATPVAAITTIYAELYGGDAKYGSKLVAISTLCTIFSMPIVALLLKI